jgi:hypothetical protein
MSHTVLRTGDVACVAPAAIANPRRIQLKIHSRKLPKPQFNSGLKRTSARQLQLFVGGLVRGWASFKPYMLCVALIGANYFLKQSFT